MRLYVQANFPEGWADVGSVLLPAYATTNQIRGALAGVGVDLPGTLEIDWCGCYIGLLYGSEGSHSGLIAKLTEFRLPARSEGVRR